MSSRKRNYHHGTRSLRLDTNTISNALAHRLGYGSTHLFAGASSHGHSFRLPIAINDRGTADLRASHDCGPLSLKITSICWKQGQILNTKLPSASLLDIVHGWLRTEIVTLASICLNIIVWRCRVGLPA